MLNESLKVRGDILFKLIDGQTNSTRSVTHVRNLITNTGKKYFVDRVLGKDTSLIDQIYIGDSTQPPNVNDITVYSASPKVKSVRFLDSAENTSNQFIVETAFLDTLEDTPDYDISEIALFSNSAGLIARTVINNQQAAILIENAGSTSVNGYYFYTSDYLGEPRYETEDGSYIIEAGSGFFTGSTVLKSPTNVYYYYSFDSPSNLTNSSVWNISIGFTQGENPPPTSTVFDAATSITKAETDILNIVWKIQIG